MKSGEKLVLGIEGTAWNLSAAVVSMKGVIAEAESTYTPPSGGIHPREAAQHHSANIGEVLDRVFNTASSEGVLPEDLSAVAFSQGPGLGPCLRTVATSARALSLTLGIPLIGVNHCVAHIEVGRWNCGMRDPVVLYVSGANSQVIAYRRGRYRVFGETLDISIGNALDKFARYVGLQHPGGPKVEKLAEPAEEYVPLPYVVKGMDFSFSGLATAARDAFDAGAPLGNVCRSFQETAFSMLVEVGERALAHCGKSEMLLVGGVAANRRLNEMLSLMCEDRGARFDTPEDRFVRDNGAMIAITGLIMLENGITTPVEASAVNPNYRTDEVEVTWID